MLVRWKVPLLKRSRVTSRPFSARITTRSPRTPKRFTTCVVARKPGYSERRPKGTALALRHDRHVCEMTMPALCTEARQTAEVYVVVALCHFTTENMTFDSGIRPRADQRQMVRGCCPRGIPHRVLVSCLNFLKWKPSHVGLIAG